MKRENMEINNLLKRLDKLEKAVFGKPSQKNVKNKSLPGTAIQAPHKKYKGAKGGIIMLIEEGLFKKKRTAKEVRAALEHKEYNYTIQVVQTALNRVSSKQGPLVAFVEGGGKVYVNRK